MNDIRIRAELIDGVVLLRNGCLRISLFIDLESVSPLARSLLDHRRAQLTQWIVALSGSQKHPVSYRILSLSFPDRFSFHSKVLQRTNQQRRFDVDAPDEQIDPPHRQN